MSDSRQIADRLLRYRVKRGISKMNLSKEIHISHVTLDKIERGEEVMPITLKKLEMALDELEA